MIVLVMRTMKKFLKRVISAILFFILAIVSINGGIVFFAKNKIYKSVVDLPEKEVVLILGARVYANGKMSDIFFDRARTGLEVYKKGKAKKILVSGDHGAKYYDEVNVVKNFLLEEGVPEQDIFLDHAGFDTYDSLYRAKNIFNVSTVSISTQNFHLSRSIYIANSLGLDAVGISANKRKYLFEKNNNFREFFARIKAFLDISFKSDPKLFGEKIPISGDGKKSWDIE